MEEKPSDKLVRGEAHDAAAAAAAIILVEERHFIVVHGDKPRIGDRRAMRVAGEIREHAQGSAERRLGVDDEWALSQRALAVVEGLRPGERGQFRRSSALPSRMRSVEEQAAECLRQRMDGEIRDTAAPGHLLRRNAQGRRAHLPADLRRHLRQGRGFAKLYDRKNSLTAADLLNDRMIPFYDEHAIPLHQVLTDRGTEYCATHDRHEYELYPARRGHRPHPDQGQEPADPDGIDKRLPPILPR